MGFRTAFLQLVKKSGYKGDISVELDENRSQYPPTLASGYASWADSTGQKSVLAVPSGKVFQLENIFVANDGAEDQAFVIYDGPGASVPVMKIFCLVSTNELLQKLKGYLFASSVCASLTTSVSTIRVGGLLRDA